ncbi:unnamed protein product [Litomosoides sigmodontis]|uniref:Uncharacterized protein n=1 Tax=Litomosoides sigmodontis TaxID=42156 RepID=A0A3P7JRD2_LITSI|nr:unnamed protein product [Litomosoides sigmodontis]
MAMLGLKSLLVYLILPDDQRLFASNYNRETIDDNQTGEEFLEEILRRLKCKEYSEVYGLIIAASDGIIMSVYRELFRAIFDEYDDDFNESGVSDSNLENTLVLLKSYGTTKNKLSVVLECSDRANSWKAFIMLGSFMEEIMPEMEDLSEQ